MNPRTRRALGPARIGLSIALALALGTTALARPGADPEAGAPFFERDGVAADPDEMPLLGTFAEVSITGDLAHVTLIQLYQNRTAAPIEATYVFPGSTRAAVTGLTMTLGERVIRAVIREREEAREVYEDAKEAGKATALLEQIRPNVLRTSVANIAPGEVIQVEIAYVERLLSDDGVYELVVPAVVAPRYGDVGEAGAEPPAVGQALRRLAIGMPWRTMRGVSVELAAALPIREVSSPSHPVAPLAGGAFYTHHHTELFGARGRAQAAADGEREGAPRDFVLRYRLAGEAIGAGVVLYEKDGEGYFMATIEPPARVATEDILPREYIFLLDVSGSMDGWPLETSKDLMTELLAALRPTDLFNVVTFAGASDVLSPKSLAATPANTRDLTRRVDGLTSGGGTELGEALATALALPRTAGFTRTVVVLSDGMIWPDAAVYRTIRERLGDANVFAFGVHPSPDRHVLETIARAGLGEALVISDESETAEAVGRFRAYIEAPILTDVALEVSSDLDVYDVTPSALPDLFARRPLVVSGRYRGAPRGALTVRARGARGPFTATVDLGAAVPDERHAVIATLWARERVAALGDRAAEGHDAKAEIVAIGLAHGLLTAHTSFVAVDDDPAVAGAPVTPGAQALAPPADAGGARGYGGRIGAVTGAGAGGFVEGKGSGGLGFSGTGRGGSGVGIGRIQGLGDISVGGGPGKRAGVVSRRPVIAISELSGGLSESLALALVRRRGAMLQACYERRVIELPSLAGTLRFSVEAGTDGKVTAVTLLDGGLDPTLDACVTRIVRRIALMSSREPLSLELSITFSPTSAPAP